MEASILQLFSWLLEATKSNGYLMILFVSIVTLVFYLGIKGIIYISKLFDLKIREKERDSNLLNSNIDLTVESFLTKNNLLKEEIEKLDGTGKDKGKKKYMMIRDLFKIIIEETIKGYELFCKEVENNHLMSNQTFKHLYFKNKDSIKEKIKLEIKNAWLPEELYRKYLVLIYNIKKEKREQEMLYLDEVTFPIDTKVKLLIENEEKYIIRIIKEISNYIKRINWDLEQYDYQEKKI